MNGRIEDADTPEERLAAVIVSVLKRRPEKEWWRLDYADFAAALRPYVRRELLNVQLEEVRRQRTPSVNREQTLFQELADAEGQIARLTL